MTVEEAAGRAIATSGAAVLFAGATVVIAICGLAIAGIPAVTVMGLMAALTVAVMVAIALTLLPALLGFAGHRIDAIRVPGLRAGAGRARPRVAVAPLGPAGVGPPVALPGRRRPGALCLLAAPAFAMRLGMTDNGASPHVADHPPGLRPAGRRLRPRVQRAAAARRPTSATPRSTTWPRCARPSTPTPGVQAVAPVVPNDEGTAAVLRVIPTRRRRTSAPPTWSTTCATTSSPRPPPAPGAEVYVGGQTATFIDMSDKVADRLPWFVGAVIVLSVVLLMMVFRSVAVPLKAAAMNLLSIGAAYGVIVAVFQWGWLKGLFGVEETVPIVSFMPMMLFAILFGLSHGLRGVPAVPGARGVPRTGATTTPPWSRASRPPPGSSRRPPSS